MEDIGALLMVALVAGVIVVVISWAVGESNRRTRNLQAAAAHFGGTIVESFWSGSSLVMNIDGASATLSYFTGSKNAPPWTRLQCEWGPKGTLRLAPEGFWAGVRKAFGAQDIQTGDRAFDDAFLIQGSPEAWVREVVDADVRRHVDVLAAMNTHWYVASGVRIDAGMAGVTIQVPRLMIGDEGLLIDFIENCVAILRMLRAGGKTAGVVVTAQIVSQSGKCPVCGAALDSTRRECERCRTPHHSDCWAYFGGCAIYGCTKR